MNQNLFFQTLIALLVLGVGTDSYLLLRHQAIPAVAGKTSPESAPLRASINAPGESVVLPNFSALVAQNGPSVVNISVSGNAKVSTTSEPQNDPFADSSHRFQPSKPQSSMPTRGLGSGFIVRPDGVIITNAHVVEDASEVTVKLTDKREFKAKLIGIDKATDTAVLKIDAHDLPVVRLGDPSQAAVGDWVLAIGSPFGFENSVSAGIISAKSRALPDEGYVAFIQTDVAVNPGNSGGPLFNTNGEVIGINSQIYTQSGGYQGLSFAVPIDIALKVEQQLLNNGKVSRGRLGVGVQALTQALADSFGLDKPSGVLVISAFSDGSAAKAGIRAGDIILKLNGVDMPGPTEMGPLVADLKPSSQATLTVWRNGQSKLITMRVYEANDDTQQASAAAELSESRLGLAVHSLPQDGDGQADGTGGLMVEQSSGPAARAGIAPGDVLLAINGYPLANDRQLRELVAKAGKHVALLVRRRDEKLFVAVDLS